KQSTQDGWHRKASQSDPAAETSDRSGDPAAPPPRGDEQAAAPATGGYWGGDYWGGSAPPRENAEPPAEPPNLVTLNQAAGMVKRQKRTLENYKPKGPFPAPSVEGGGGMPDLWDWAVIRPWLEETFKMTLPKTCPPNRSR